MKTTEADSVQFITHISSRLQTCTYRYRARTPVRTCAVWNEGQRTGGATGPAKQRNRKHRPSVRRAAIPIRTSRSQAQLQLRQGPRPGCDEAADSAQRTGAGTTASRARPLRGHAICDMRLDMRDSHDTLHTRSACGHGAKAQAQVLLVGLHDIALAVVLHLHDLALLAVEPRP
jgi:hypothetical protein